MSTTEPDSQPEPKKHLATAEDARLKASRERTANWKRWGPYLSERQWGTVREDYSDSGNCWDYFPHDHARSRAYRWGEDGLMGFCDRECRLCFAVTLWNGRDTILKERLFGLSGPEGNHGEDVKECYYYLDSSPTHSYVKLLYKYPQAEFPYAWLTEENRRRGREQPEFEILDTGLFNEGKYFDVQTEYAKASPDDILIRITVSNRGPESAAVHLLPTLWFRNSWSWGCTHEGCEPKPLLQLNDQGEVTADQATLGRFRWIANAASDGTRPAFLFTENETNSHRLYGYGDPNSYVKDAFHQYLIEGRREAVNPNQEGTKAAAHYQLTIPAGESRTVELRVTQDQLAEAEPFGPRFDTVFADRQRETDEFYDLHLPAGQGEEERRVTRQSYAGLLISKQFYHYVVKDWLHGDPSQPMPPERHQHGRNTEWKHLFNRDIISMPDKWEYPWYAAWDLAFHMLPFAKVDRDFAQEQLILFLREWYLHPNGQIPAYEFAFSDVNPPVHAWACWRVYKMTGSRGHRDVSFLKRVFYKLLLNFNWWVNRKDPEGKNLFSGGFLGLDNIGVFDRSRPLPTGHYLEQADGTAWMAFYCLTMLSIAMELATHDDTFEDIASKFFEHFVEIVDAMNTLGGTGLWDEQDGFYYDVIRAGGASFPLRVRSMVGIIPLFAVEVLDQEQIDRLPGFKKRMEWFLKHRPDLGRHISYCQPGMGTNGHSHGRHYRLLAIPSRERLERMLKYILDESEFLSPYGVRALSRFHKDHPFVFQVDGQDHRVNYDPAESTSGLFGGNSNWRGPVWFPVNFLLIEALERYHHFYGDSLQVEYPTGSGNKMNLKEVARVLARRLTSLFLPDENGRRPAHGDDPRYANDPHWRDLVLFYEYFDGDNGRGLGANHQTGWTALVSQLLEDVARHR
ncbi:MGH1-like glycoside hydrolase domain-containing protein [Planctomicrobium piriforme]|uniref:MGH1-like glycoside hydrolase domain-containing protein n=1 Tax=Planctomicrobium piriforme TaxID=1576369 RepID=UPI000B883A7B|nr:glucosidase [Planctomicrobium piriforme]